VLDATVHATGLSPNRARSLLGRFLFSGEEAEKPLAGLSGGERRRLSLAVLVGADSKAPNVLILDEPTNHLDLESREALEDALRSFKGAILLVSHDRALLDAVGNRTIAVEGRALQSYLGGWPEYARVRDERRAGLAPDPQSRPSPSADEDRAAHEPPAKKQRKPRAKGPSKNRLSEQEKATLAVEEAEASMRALEEELADPAAWATQYESAKSEARHTAARRAVEDAYARLEALID
jgi:ATP-binding cassette subfamily F protein 3